MVITFFPAWIRMEKKGKCRKYKIKKEKKNKGAEARSIGYCTGWKRVVKRDGGT